MKRIAVIGAAAVGDYIFEVEHLPKNGEIVAITGTSGEFIPGGCAPNIACGIANWGKAVPVLYYPVGNDFSKWDMQSDWEKRGIDCRLTYVPDAASGCAWMYMQEDGTTMCFSYAGAAGIAEAAPEVLEEEYVIIAPILNTYTIAYLEKAIARSSKIIVTGIGSKDLIPYMEYLDVLIINRCESEQILRESGFQSMSAFSVRYSKLKIYVTCGNEGSRLYKKGSVFRIPIVKASDTVDFTGAGDAYTGGVVSAMAEGLGDIQAGYAGACASSFAIERMGGQTYRNDWASLLERLGEQYPKWKEEKEILEKEEEK